MAVRVITYLMPRSQYRASNFRTLAHIFADEKKRRFRIVPGQYIQQMHRVRIIGAIVKGKRHLLGVAAMRERAAIKLRCRRHGGVSGIAGGSGGSESDEGPKHGSGNW